MAKTIKVETHPKDRAHRFFMAGGEIIAIKSIEQKPRSQITIRFLSQFLMIDITKLVLLN